MPIDASEPTVISATYDKWAFEFSTRGFGVDGSPVMCFASLAKYRIRDDGTGELSPLDSDRVSVAVPDLFALMATDADVASAFAGLVVAVQKIAQAQGKI